MPEAELEQLWNQMHEIANREGVSLLELSGAMTLFAVDKVGTLGQGALSTVKVTGNMFDRHILDHYRQGLSTIRKEGFYQAYATISRPYIAAVWQNFAEERTTITADLLSGRLFARAWNVMRQWFRRS
jgi:hypothetical protein